MASVHKVNRTNGKSSPYYYAAFRSADGTAFFKSTKKKNRAEALAVAMDFERMARGHVTEAHYRRVASELYERTTGEPLNFHTAGEWLGEWLANTNATVKGGTYEKYRGTVDDFREYLGDRDGAPLASITPKEILGYRDTLQKRGLAASTINLAIRKTLHAPFEAARRLGYVTVNPCAAIKPVRDNVAKAKARRQPFTHEQIAALLTATKGTNWEGAILCGTTTALRLGDIAALTWAQIDLPARVLRLTTTKTETEQSIPLHPAFVAWLGEQTRGIGKAPVFPELHGRKTGGCRGLSQTFRGLMEKAGVLGAVIRKGVTAEAKKKAENKARTGRTISTLTFHSLRHTATSLLANAGIAADTRKAITGHADDRVHEAYTHYQLETLRAAVESIPVPGAPALAPKPKAKPKAKKKA
jgi:integrase